MRIYTKEYYTLLMSLGEVELYEPIIDKEYTEEDIEDLYQQAMDKYVQEEQVDYDAPPEELIAGHTPIFEDMPEIQIAIVEHALDEYENRSPFDEEEAREEFEEMYRDNLEEPDEDLPAWVRETVDKRILAMYLLPEKVYRKLAAEEEANQEKFDDMDMAADEASEAMEEALPEDCREFMEVLTDLEDADVLSAEAENGGLILEILGWNDEGDEEVRRLEFKDVNVIEDDGLAVKSWEDEDGDSESDCELLYSEMYIENGRPEIHMMFDNNGLKYFTFSCSSFSF